MHDYCERKTLLILKTFSQVPNSASKSVFESPQGALRIASIQAQPVSLSVVLPTYNERDNLPHVLDELTTSLRAAKVPSYELIVVDDDSADCTWEVALKFALKDPNIRVVRRIGERGLASAIVRGWQISNGDVLAVLDADLQHPPLIMVDLWNAMRNPATDMAVATRHSEGGELTDWHIVRRAISWCAKILGWLLLPNVFRRVSDPMSGCFAVRRTAIQNVTFRARGYKILIELLARCEITNLVQVGYSFSSRQEGRSKATFKVALDYLVQIVTLRLSSNSRTI